MWFTGQEWDTPQLFERLSEVKQKADRSQFKARKRLQKPKSQQRSPPGHKAAAMAAAAGCATTASSKVATSAASTAAVLTAHSGNFMHKSDARPSFST